MPKILGTALLAATLSAGALAPALAADTTATVIVKPGTSSAAINGSLKGYDTHYYVLGANAGQQIKVTLRASNGSCYFNFDAPTGDAALFNGSVSIDGAFAGTLPQTGDYKAMVYLMRNAARRNEICRYTISFAIDN